MTESRPPTATAVSVGDEGPVVTVEALEREDFVRYAGASGDFNPLHYDEEYVREAGHDGVFGQGMFVGGVASRVVTRWFGVETVSAFDVRFTATVRPGDSLRATGVVEEKRQVDGRVVVTVALEVETGDETTVATGSARVTLPAE